MARVGHASRYEMLVRRALLGCFSQVLPAKRGVAAAAQRRGGKLGILTDQDPRSASTPPASPGVPVGELPTTPVVSARAEEASTELMLAMLDHGILKSASDHKSTCSSASRPGAGRARCATRRAHAAISESRSASGSPPRSRPTAACSRPSRR